MAYYKEQDDKEDEKACKGVKSYETFQAFVVQCHCRSHRN